MPYFMGCHWYNCTAILRFDEPPEGTVVCQVCEHKQKRTSQDDCLSVYFAALAARHPERVLDGQPADVADVLAAVLPEITEGRRRGRRISVVR